MAVATCANWICNMILALVFLSALQTFGGAKTFLAFAIFNSVCLLLVFFLIPETKDISLEHIETNLLAGKRLRDLGADWGKA
jgi:SP family galactose:H+ symporter-like MFS transporter